MAEPIKSYYEALLRDDDAVKAAKSRREASLQALLAQMPEGVEFSTDPNPAPIIKREGNKIVQVPHPSIHVAFNPEAK